MSPELGHFALALACALAFAQAIVPLWGAHRGLVAPMRAAPALAAGQLMALSAAFLCLAFSAATDDFTVLNVAENSARLKPLLYKLTGIWGNHEGSILLWALILALCGGAVAAWGGSLPSAMRARVIGVLGGVSAGFLLFALLTSNPFLRLWPPPPDGRGMNPLLQDPGLAFHPPVLYAGYVGFAVPFAFAVAALLDGKVDALWGRWVRPWALAAWCFLTSGIALGSWWAYYELGWGGYWAWDPVENASLMPWLTGTALLHSAVVVEKREALKVWSVLLAIGTFSLSLSGTFLVRSGILNSVHAFANDPARGVFILGLLGVVIGGSWLLFAWRAPLLTPGGLFAPFSREGALVLNNVLLVSTAAVVLTGTLYPPLTDLLADTKISVGPAFFQWAILPLIVPLVAAMSVGPVLAWKRASLRPVLRRVWKPALLAALMGGWAIWRWGILPGLAFGAAFWLALGGVLAVIAPMGQSGWKTALTRLRGVRLSVWGGAIAHAGLGLSLAGMGGMVMAQKNLVALHEGQSVSMAGYEWRLQSIDHTVGPNYTAVVARILVSRDGRLVARLSPSRRRFSNGRVIADTAIRTNGLRDLYVVMGDLRPDGAVLHLFDNTLAPWIWLGALVMAGGGGLSLIDRRLRIGAPGGRRL